MSIAILCPTRGRPEQCRRMIQSVNDTTSSNIIILLDTDEQYFADDFLKNLDQRIKVIRIETHENLPTAHKWNWLADFARKQIVDEKEGWIHFNKLFMLGSDDMYFDTPGWDKALLDHYNALENKIHVYALQDSRDPDGTPHPIVTREYIDALGYFVPPIFLHWYVDSWTVEIARANNCFTHLKDYLLVHDKPSDKGVCDETHNRIRQWGWHERDKRVNDKCRHFLEHEKFRLMNGGKHLWYVTKGQ